MIHFRQLHALIIMYIVNVIFTDASVEKRSFWFEVCSFMVCLEKFVACLNQVNFNFSLL
jgi:hypothetical protein